MRHLQTFSGSSSTLTGLVRMWGDTAPWSIADGRLRRDEVGAEEAQPLALTAVPATADGEVVALTQCYQYTTIDRPIGVNRGVAVRVSSTGGPGRHAIVAHILVHDGRLVLRVQQTVGEATTTLGSVAVGEWSHLYSDHLIRIRLRADGAMVRASAWMDTEDEPRQWMLTAATTVLASGRIGVMGQGIAVQEYVWVGAGTGRDAAPVGGQGLPAETGADFRGVVPLMLSMCYPLYGDGTQADPRALTYPGNDIDAALPGYRAARARAIRIAMQNRVTYPPPGDTRVGYSHCSRFSGTVIINTLDPLFAADYTLWQNQYMADYRNGWVQVGSGETYDPSWCRPGDVWITREQGHVFVWLGQHGGHQDVIAEAAFNGINGEYGYSRVGSLRRYYLDANGQDHIGRPYSAWRFVGRPPNRFLLQTAAGLEDVEAYLQTADSLVPQSP